MLEIILLCLPYWFPAVVILAVAGIGHIFNIKCIKESHRF